MALYTGILIIYSYSYQYGTPIDFFWSTRAAIKMFEFCCEVKAGRAPCPPHAETQSNHISIIILDNNSIFCVGVGTHRFVHVEHINIYTSYLSFCEQTTTISTSLYTMKAIFYQVFALAGSAVIQGGFSDALGGFKIQNPFDLSGNTVANGEPVPGESPFTLCDEDLPRLLDIHHINIDPNPPEKGANLTIEAAGYLKKQVDEGAFVEVDVRYGYIRLVNEKFDLCEQISHVDMECPLEEGPQTIKKVVELPDEVPPGKYLVNARAFTVDEELITCLSATVEFPYNGF